MFQVKNLVRTGAARPQLPSMPFSMFVEELAKTGFSFDSITTTHSTNLNQTRLILGVNGKDGFIDYTKPFVGIRLSSKLRLKGTTDLDVFNELFESHPVYFGESTIKSTPEEIEDGAEETRKVSWVTAAPAGEYEPKKATAIDVAALLGNVAGMPTKK